jgi:hypothetical protein
VVYEWLPPFCSKCQLAGHDCNKQSKKAESQKPGPQQPGKKQWIPKTKKSPPTEPVSGPNEKSTSQPVEQSLQVTQQHHIGQGQNLARQDPVVDHTTKELSLVASTPYQSPPPTYSDDDGGWKVVTRRKDRGKRVIFAGRKSRQLT